MEAPTVLIALADPRERRALEAALTERHVAVVHAPDRSSVLRMLAERPMAVALDLGLGDALGRSASVEVTGGRSSPIQFLGEVIGAAAGLPVAVRPTHTTAVEAVLAAGAAEVLEPGGSPALAAHRLVERMRAAAERRPNVEPDDFRGRLQERLLRAREREGQVPVFVVRIVGTDLRGEAELRGAIEEAALEIERTTELAINAARAVTVAVGDDGTALFVPDLARVQDAARFASALRTALARRTGGQVHLGVASSPTDGVDPDTLVKHALAASRRALRDGQGEIVFHSDAMGRWAFERLTLEGSLRNALQNRELVLYYQPRVDIETREIRGMEALLRWIHPQFGLVSPGQFIPLAEETGLIVPIGEWIVGEAARQNKAWRDAGLPHIRVSVNLSPVQFRRPDLFDRVAQAVRASGLEPSGLELEVTESLLMNDPTQTAATLRRFKAFGLKLSIDDFGTGYSSLSYLKRFPIDALKIDRSFVTDVTTNPDDAAITTAIILMGHSLKLKVVAEGVETENQLAFLKVLQCNEAQGYLFSPPVPAEKAAGLLGRERLASRVAA